MLYVACYMSWMLVPRTELVIEVSIGLSPLSCLYVCCVCYMLVCSFVKVNAHGVCCCCCCCGGGGGGGGMDVFVSLM